MYRKRFNSGIKKKSEPVPSKLSEKSTSLTLNQNNFENKNFISQQLIPTHNSLPDTNLFNKFSQDRNSSPRLFIKPQLTIEKAREISQSQKSNTSQKSLTQYDENSNFSTEERKNLMKTERKMNNFDKKEQNNNQDEENSKINLKTKLEDTQSSIQADVKSRNITKKQQNSNLYENKAKIGLSVEKKTIKAKGKSKNFNKKGNNSKQHHKAIMDVGTKRRQKEIVYSIQRLNGNDYDQQHKKNITSKLTPNTTGQSNENKAKTEDNAISNRLQKKSSNSGKTLKDLNKNKEKNKENKTPYISQIVTLSQPDKDISHRERLEWLRDRRGVGTWIQCCNNDCSKWRYEPNIKDPVDVPDKWFCNMNSDVQLADCEAPEIPLSAEIEEDLIHNTYTAGSIVWARLRGYPWWPGIIDDDPDTEQYYWLNDFSDIPTHYHVVFFDSNTVSRNWLEPKDLTSFKTGKEHTRTKFGKKDYKNQLKISKSQALEALQLDIPERLKKYGFLSRWNGAINTPVPSVIDSDEEPEAIDDLDNLVQLSHNLASSHNDSLVVYVKKNRKRKIKTLDRNDDIDLDTLVELSRELNSSFNDSFDLNDKKGSNKNRKRKILVDKNKSVDEKLSGEVTSSHNDSFKLHVKKGLKKNRKQDRKILNDEEENDKAEKGLKKNIKRKILDQENETDLNTSTKASLDLNSNDTGSFNRNVYNLFKKKQKRKILDDDSPSLEIATKLQNSDVSKSLKENISSGNIPKFDESLITNSNDVLALNNATITNELFKDLINHRGNEITSTVDKFTDIVSLHSSDMFDSDDEN